MPRAIAIAALTLAGVGACADSNAGVVGDRDAAAFDASRRDARSDDAGTPTATGGGARPDLPYATELIAFTPGEHAGFGTEALPDVVLGPPAIESGGGSLNVLSLGVGGEIVLGFSPRAIVDGPGPDLLVFENAFFIGGDRSRVFAEAGEVAVSEDGETWHVFACAPPDRANDPGPGCAGNTPTETYDPETLVPLDPAQTGGDGFDLADLPLARARYVRIRDRAQDGAGDNGGFDLDAVGLIHHERTPTDGGVAP